MKKTNGYWLYFEPYVHISLKKNLVLLYNTINGERVITRDLEIIKLVYATQHYLNQGVVCLEQALYEQTAVSNFIEEIRDKFIGDIIDVEVLPEKPIQFIPIPNLYKGTVKPKSTIEELKIEDIFSYFHFLTIQINNQCNLLCSDCSYVYKQIFNCFCNRNNNVQEMPFAQIEQIYHQIKTIPLKRIYLSGGNIFLHSEIHKILELFEEMKFICSLGVHYLNFPAENQLEKLHGYKLEIFVNPPYQVSKIENIIHLLKKKYIDYLFRFRLTSDNDFELISTKFLPMIEENKYAMEPFYTGNNLDFLEKNVFLEESDIFEEPIPQRTIFANQILNSNFFGHIYINCAGEVKSNQNSKHLLGHISTEKIYQLISNELLHNYSWKNTRTKSPCNKCIYQFLCPPISNYELVLGKNNLCNINT